LAERIGKIKVGHALGRSTDIGPVVSLRSWSQDLSYIEIGRAKARSWFGRPEALLEIPKDTTWHLALFTETIGVDEDQPRRNLRPCASVMPARDTTKRWRWPIDTPFGCRPASPPLRSSTRRISSAIRRPAW